jgi:hypothetical protein
MKIPLKIPKPNGEQGSALILAVLISVVLSLLGISYLLMAQTENTIAENERNSMLALFAAESGTRLAINWFNDPSAAGYLVPTSGQVTRTDRLVDDDNNPATPLVLASAGTAAKPLYKDATFTASPIFDRPYRSSKSDTFIGIETGTDADPNFATKGPDIVVTQAHLDTINNALFPNFPSPSLQAKISRIEFYSPPIVNIGGSDTRMGIATIKVTAGLFIFPGTGDERQIATRIVKAVVNEIPIPGPGGPLQSCQSLSYSGAFEIHWGAASSLIDADLGLTSGNLDNKAWSGMPYAVNDPYSYYSGGGNDLGTWATAHDNDTIEDPWFAFMAGGQLLDIAFAPHPTEKQPWHFDDVAWPGNEDYDHSNLFQSTVINCPTFEYPLWKAIAQSGNKNHWYFKWDNADNYLLDGKGTPQSFENLSEGRVGIMFFDTIDGQPWDGKAWTDSTNNLAPAVHLSSNSWGIRGFAYLNMDQFSTQGVGSGGLSTFVIPPGEPGDGAGFVNLDYSGAAFNTQSYRISDGTVNFESIQNPTTGEWWCTDAQQCDSGGQVAAVTPVRDEYGLPFIANTALDGVMYTSGNLEFQGNANYYGSVIAEQGVSVSTGNPAFWFDETLVKGDWPRKDMQLPRVVVTAWQTDL